MLWAIATESGVLNCVYQFGGALGSGKEEVDGRTILVHPGLYLAAYMLIYAKKEVRKKI